MVVIAINLAIEAFGLETSMIGLTTSIVSLTVSSISLARLYSHWFASFRSIVPYSLFLMILFNLASNFAFDTKKILSLSSSNSSFSLDHSILPS